MKKTKRAFDKWNNEKKDIHFSQWKNTFIKEWHIYFTKLGQNIWFEQNWKEEFERPVLVISKIWNMFFSIPMTTQWKNNEYHYKLTSTNFSKDSFLILSQWKALDRKRFLEEIWYVSKNEFLEIKKLLKKLYLRGA